MRAGFGGELPVREYSRLAAIPEVWWFLSGNLVYFGVGICLAVALRDNRAFCRYVCPILAFLKPAAGARSVEGAGG